MKNNYREIVSMQQLCEARQKLNEQLQDADREFARHWNSLLDSAEPVNIAARVARNIFDIVSQAAMMERIYRTVQSFLHTLFGARRLSSGNIAFNIEYYNGKPYLSVRV